MRCPRVLIFLEAEALGQAPPDFAVHLLGDLLHAAQTLGLRSLQVKAFQVLPSTSFACHNHHQVGGFVHA